MASLIPGYEYDIFISYRQKDNKGDHWVTDFVEALKTELESTFKEEVSVYFDINPHDGLLETHDVDESLKEKLKCLVFIPIISRTYCDPKSFAWEHEFKAFVEQASKDHFGLKIKLPNGNVANRVLPIRIHDLDVDDLKLCESITGGFLRGVEFIYKEPGVNKPLAIEDDDKKNLNNTKYRIQINKVANAIKEIISGLRTEPLELVKEKVQHGELLEDVIKEERKGIHDKPAKSPNRKLLSGILVSVILVIAAIIAYPKIFKQDTLEKLRSSGERISVAVMPFQNMTNDTTKNILEGWIQDNLINLLSNSEELKVKQTESISAIIKSKGITANASITPSLAGLVSRKLDANIFIYGSIKKDIASLRLTAQLIDSKTEEIFKYFQIDIPSQKDVTNENIDSLSAMVKDYLEVSKLKNEGPINLQGMLSSVNSPEAYRYFIAGKKAFEELDYPVVFYNLSKAIEIDSNFTYAPILLAQAYGIVGRWEEGRKLVLHQYRKREQMSYQMKTYTDWIYACYFETPYERIKYMKQLLEIDDQSPDYHFLLGVAYHILYQYDKAIPEYQEALEINFKWDSKPWWSGNYTYLGGCYHSTAQYHKEKKLYKRAEQDFPDNPDILTNQAILSFTLGDSIEANRYIGKYLSISKKSSISDADIRTGLVRIYTEGGVLDKAEAILHEALLLEPENPVKMNNLAYFLIDKDRNIKEGLELADRTLGINPDNYDALDSKGWGLYKQGKYQEALEILQKSWDIRLGKAIYIHEAFLHLEAAKKAVAGLKNN
jgi:tetratricopeptide (TPR) repeat protein